MRTTIELSDEHRSRLLALAAERGEKGFSAIVAEAVDEYLKLADDRAAARTRALALRGVLSRRDADGLRTAVAEWREHWR